MKKGYIAYNLTASAREKILNLFPPKFSNVIAHHTTFSFGVNENTPLPEAADIEVIGYACNNNIECVVVNVNGSSVRGDGGTYHITLSHNDNAKPVHSNDLIKEGFDLVTPITLETVPTFNAFGK